MSETEETFFTTCNATVGVDDVTGMLQCVSDANEQYINDSISDLAVGLDTFFLIYSASLVFFMQAGFAMLCAGSIRAKNVKNVILWNLLDSCGGGIAFWALGFAFIYGGDDATDPSQTFIGDTAFFVGALNGVPLQVWLFQWGFACATSSIVAGTIAERTSMKAYLIYSMFLCGFAYPVVAHALWSTQGFLSKFNLNPIFGSGVIDLAGSGAVHLVGGTTAFVGGLILGPRIGRFHDRDGNLLPEPAEFTPHSTALSFLGTFCLWFGWYGFNPGSVLFTSTKATSTVVALAAMNTTLAACAGALSAMFFGCFYDWRVTGVATYDVVATMNGCLTALAAVTSGCATYDTWAAVVVGLFAGGFYLIGSKLLIRFRFDDAVDAVPVHMVGGLWGLIATGLFTSPTLLANAYPASQNDHFGWFYEWSEGSGDFNLMGAQLVAILFIFSWTFTVMGLWFYMLNYFGWFRVDPLEEEAGLDVSRHKGSAYDISAAAEDVVEKLTLQRSSRHVTDMSKDIANESGAEIDA